MTPPTTPRSVAALALAAGLFLALPGCGDKPDAKGDKKDKKEDPKPLVTDPKDKKEEPKTPAKPPEKVELNSGVGKEAVEFLTALREGKAGADKLSVGFVKRLGLPAELPSDQKKGYSAGEAETRLRRLGGGLNFFPPSGFAGDNAAVLWGAFMSPERNGGYSLRMVNEGGAWKVDYLSLSSANFTAVNPPGGGPEAEYQRFAARAVGGALCDKNGMPKDERAAVIATGLIPDLRTAWGKPFESDTKQGFDYSTGTLLLTTDKYAGAESYSVTQQGDAPEFRLDVTKPGGAKSAYTMKLAKGTTPGQWLVESITPQ